MRNENNLINYFIISLFFILPYNLISQTYNCCKLDSADAVKFCKYESILLKTIDDTLNQAKSIILANILKDSLLVANFKDFNNVFISKIYFKIDDSSVYSFEFSIIEKNGLNKVLECFENETGDYYYFYNINNSFHLKILINIETNEFLFCSYSKEIISNGYLFLHNFDFHFNYKNCNLSSP